MEQLKDFKDFLSLPYLCAKLVGIDLTQKRETYRFKLSILAMAYGLFNFCYLNFAECIYLYQHRSELANLLAATKIGAYVAYGVNTNSKIVAVLTGKGLLRNVLRVTEDIYPKTYDEKLAYRVNENFWPRSIYILVGTYFAAGYVVYLLPLFQSIYEYLRNAEFTYETPFFISHPFNSRTKLGYSLIYFSELTGGQLSICSNIGIDLLMCCVARQLCMHFKYIGQEIERYRPTGRREDNAILAKLIKRHQLIFKLCLDLNEIFGISLVFNFISSSGIICLSAFQATIEENKVELTKFFLLTVSTVGQLFIINYFGDQLISCSLDVGQSVYNHPWYRGNASYKKQVIIMIVRCQKPAILTAKGFCIVSLLNFTEVISMSYKVFALLNTFYAEN